MNLIWLILVWTLWCLLHSLLIHASVEQRFANLLGRYRRAYRLIYNGVALITLLPVGLVYLSSDATPLLVWPAWLLPLQLIWWSLAAFLVWAGGRVYNMRVFSGLHQLAGSNAQPAGNSLSDTGELVTRGILRHSRHPWYLAGLLLLWCRDLETRDLATNLVLTAYLLGGIWLEERRLVQQFGEEYRQYREKVPMLWGLPFRDNK